MTKVVRMATIAVPSPVYGIPPILLIAAAFALPLLSLLIKNKKFYDAYTFVFGVIALLSAIDIFSEVLAEGRPVVYPFGGWPPPIGIVYEVDLFGAVLGLLTAAVMLLIIVYSWWYTEGMDGVEWYYTLLLGMEVGLLGCIYTGDAFNLFVMLEVLGVSAYGLVAFYRSRPEAVEAAVKYAMIGATATTIYFIALVFLYGSYQTLNMADLALKARYAHVLVSTLSGGIFGNPLVASAVAIALSLWVFTFKAALFPNHFWLPDAHPEAPTPVSAALSGLVVNVGVYAVVRFMYTIFGYGSVLDRGPMNLRDVIMLALITLGAASAIVGAMLMAVQRDVKRLLAYSTINHMGFLFMALGVGLSATPREAVALALAALVFHLINHSVGKSLLFMSTGVLIKAVGSRDLDALAGLGRRAPIAGFAIVIGALNLLGIVPLAGFFSKYMMYQAFLAANQPVLALLLILASAISIAGYAKLIYIVLGKPSTQDVVITEDGRASFVLLVLSLTCIALTVALPLGFSTLLQSVGKDLLNVGAYIGRFFTVMTNLTPGGG